MIKRHEFDSLSNRVIGCALQVHRNLGPGLLESAYEQCMAHELSLADIAFKTQWPLPVEYKGLKLDCGFRVDMLVDDKLIVEVKSVEKLLGIHQAQLLTYMKLARIHIGLLINFNVVLLRQGIRRMVL
jgi:GxxExxY protein